LTALAVALVNIAEGSTLPKTDNLATPELAEKPKKRKVVLVPATGAKLTKTSKKLLPTKLKKPPPKMLKVKMPKLPLKKIPSQLNLKFNI
jgi:hypothetical protein